MALSEHELASVADGDVVNAAGEKLGGIGQIYLDDETGEPTWATVKTGLFGTSESFVPLTGARVVDSNLQVDYDKDTIKNAPRVEADGHLDPSEEQALYDYYGIGGQTGGTDQTRGVGYAGDAGTVRSDAGVFGSDSDSDAELRVGRDRDTIGEDTSGRTDDAMTLSEERLNVGTRTEETGRARLRKYVVTENVTQTVPVQREEVRVEREPITDENVGDATSGPAISEAEHEVVLHEERPVVEKEAVPVERVRLEADTVTDQETVSADVRKEEVDTDVDDRRR